MSQKPPILFLHGAFAGPQIWQRFVAPWFAARGHKVLVPEMPRPGTATVRLRDHVGVAREAAASLGSRPLIVGHSLGGLVAQHLAAEQRAAGVVLVSSPGPFGLAPTLWNLSARAPQVLASTLLVQAGGHHLIGVEAIRAALFTEETPDEWIHSVLPELRKESPYALFDAMTWDLPAWILARMTPALAVCGDQDTFMPASDLWTIGLTYGAETEIMPGAGHGLPIDPSWKSLAWRINAWIDERDIAGQSVSRIT